MKNNLEDEVKRIVERMENQENQDNTQIPQEDIQDIYVLIVREHEIEEKPQVVDSDSTPVTSKKVSVIPAYAICSFYLFLILSCIAFQAYEILNPPIATITIIPKSQTVTLTGTLQQGRVLQSITISQSQIVLTTGRGHQDAKNASGYVTFYNGQLNSIFVPAGLILTGSDGVQIVTDQDASIPAANLPQVGQVTIQAHAINPGVRGNIAVYDINQGCCATAIKVVNTNSFYGGVDARDFQTVTKADITNASTPLKSTVLQSMTGALQGQLKTNEQLQIVPCSPTARPNQQVGNEASQVQVPVSETCQAVAYDTQALTTKAVALLNSHALKQLGSGYSLFDGVIVKTDQATVTHNLVFLSISASGEWIYGLSRQSQEHIKELIAGKSKVQALQMLASLPGVEQASIRFTGITDDTRLPKNSTYIHIILVVM